MANVGQLKYLTVDDGNYKPGLYVFTGYTWVNISKNIQDIDATYPPIFMQAGTGINFDWNDNTKYLTISTVTSTIYLDKKATDAESTYLKYDSTTGNMILHVATGKGIVFQEG